MKFSVINNILCVCVDHASHKEEYDRYFSPSGNGYAVEMEFGRRQVIGNQKVCHGNYIYIYNEYKVFCSIPEMTEYEICSTNQSSGQDK